MLLQVEAVCPYLPQVKQRGVLLKPLPGLGLNWLLPRLVCLNAGLVGLKRGLAGLKCLLGL